MTFEITLRHSIKQARKRLTKIQRKQLPFATSQALNDIAFMGRKQIVDKTYPRDFKVRNKAFPKAVFRIRKSRKKIGPELATPAVLFDQLGRDYLKLQAIGGIKRPRDGSNIAIPGSALGRSAKGVRKGFRPRQALDRADTFKRAGFIFQKQKGRSLRVLYVLKPIANISKRFAFYEDLTRLGRDRFAALHAKRLRDALRTAR